MPGDHWLPILVESVSREISALLFTSSLRESSQECIATLSILAEVWALGTACSLFLQIQPRTLWWRGHTVTCNRRKCWSSDPAFPGDIHVLPFSIVRVSHLAGVMNLIHIYISGHTLLRPRGDRQEEGSEQCLPWNKPSLHHLFSPQTPGPTVWENPHFHHIWSNVRTPAASSTQQQVFLFFLGPWLTNSPQRQGL